MLSILIPLFNEEKVIPELFRRLTPVRERIGEHEIIFIDDGSRDATSALITERITQDAKQGSLKLISFSRNFGHQIALSAGLDHVSGEAVIILDGDLQDPPELISNFIQTWKEGADIVYAVRRRRKESVFKRMAYAGFYRLLHSLAHIDIPLDSGDFCLMDRKVIDIICAMPERNRFLRGIRAWSGFTSVALPYDREARFAGETKYSMRKLMRLAMDGLVSFSTLPLKLSTYIGFCIATLSTITAVCLIVLKLAGRISLQGWTSLMVAFFFLGGVQLFVMGIMGEYVARIYTEVQGRPLYVIKKKIGFSYGNNSVS